MEKDFYRGIVGAEINDVRGVINRMRVENNEKPYTEQELPSWDPDKGHGGYVYAEIVLSKLEEFLETNDYKDDCMVAWY